jgi:hypothetical protein
MTYTILMALWEGRPKLLISFTKKLTTKTSTSMFGGCSSSIKKCAIARWLIADGYKFGHSDLRSLAICDEFDVFEIIFDSMACAPMCVPRYKEMFDDCIRYGAFRVAQFFECVMGFDMSQVCVLVAYKAKRAERAHATIVIQMRWQNYRRRRKDPSIAIKEAEESWNKLVAEFPDKFV